jgi:hypothetical protein
MGLDVKQRGRADDERNDEPRHGVFLPD